MRAPTEQEYRPMDAKERWIGAGIGAAVTTAATAIIDITNNPIGINNAPLWGQLLFYGAFAAGGAVLGGVIAAGEGKMPANRLPKRTAPLR